jgi:hypothetical protein
MAALGEEDLQTRRQQQIAAQTRAQAHLEAASQVPAQSDVECKICRDGLPTHAAAPCGHKVFCETCALRVEEESGECPICRQDIVMTIRIFEA